MLLWGMLWFLVLYLHAASLSAHREDIVIDSGACGA